MKKGPEIKRRVFLNAVGAGSLMARFGEGSSTQRADGKQHELPNILLIVSDMTRWDTIANRSLCRTPNLNALADQGLVFNRSYTPTSPCCPARAMLATGAYHWHNGVFNQIHSPPAVSRDLFPEVPTYYERLGKAGYRMGYIGKWHVSYERTPLDFGFQEIRAPLAYNPKLLDKLGLPEEHKAPKAKRENHTVLSEFQWPGDRQRRVLSAIDEGREEETESHFLADQAIDLMGKLAAQKEPWHLELHLPEQHVRTPLRKYYEGYSPDSIPVPPNFHEEFENKPEMHRREAETWGPVSEEDYRIGRACYYAYAEQRDAQIGRVLNALEESGQADRTLVIYTADHGDICGDHHMWKVGWMPYEEILRIPMIVRWPERISPGVVSDHLVQLHDLAHTLVEISGQQALPFPDGVSLLPLFKNPQQEEWRDHILNAFYGGEFLYTQRIAITERYKYVFNGFAFDELYDLEADPHEMENQLRRPAYRRVVDDMRARLYELMAQYRDPYGDNPPERSGRTTGSTWAAPRYLPRGKRS